MRGRERIDIVERDLIVAVDRNTLAQLAQMTRPDYLPVFVAQSVRPECSPKLVGQINLSD